MSLVKACLLSALIAVVATNVPLFIRISRLVGEVERMKSASNSEWADAFMTVVRLSASGKLKIVDGSKPWLLSNASAHDCVIIGASVLPTESNSQVFNIDIPSVDDLRKSVSGKVRHAWVQGSR